MERKTWLELHPEATRLEKIEALAHDMIGQSEGPNSYQIEAFGLEEGFEITNEPYEMCVAFDAIVMCCNGCGWWTDAGEMDEDGNCEECAEDEE